MSDDIRFVPLAYGPPLMGILPALTLVALVACLARRRRVVVAPVTLLAATCVWYALGLGATSALWLGLFCAACAASVALVLDPGRLALGTPATLAVVVATGVLALEFTCNVHLYTIGPQFWLVETALVAGLVLFLWLLCGRRGVGPAVALVLLAAVGVAQHYILSFRGTSILPSDVFALGTAISVSGGYTYGLSNAMLRGFSALVLGLAATTRLRPDGTPAPARPAAHMRPARRPPQQPALRRVRDLALAALVGSAVVALAVVPDYHAVFGANINYWWSKDWYERQGFLPSFIFACQDLRLSEPEGYTEQAARASEDELAARYAAQPGLGQRRDASTAQFASRPPNVIVIQNETFCDLSDMRGLDNGYAGPAFWAGGIESVGRLLLRGDLGVSVYGGGTCNTEFEFLTGNAMAYLGTSKYPFTMYDLTDASSLARQLAQAGYRSVGMHPNVAENWNRNRAYAQLGFDEFLSIDDFQRAELFHTHVSDWATYERVLSLVDERDEPLFVFDVTMQNHSGYDTGSVPADMLPGYEVDGLSEEDTFQLNEYLGCIEESDRAFERLLKELAASAEPTVVVMYGDHHPWFSEALNDALFPDEDPVEHAARVHRTDYVVWANYDVAGWSAPAGGMRDDTSADLLAAQTLDAIGGPLTTYQQAQLGGRLDPSVDFAPIAYLNFHG